MNTKSPVMQRVYKVLKHSPEVTPRDLVNIPRYVRWEKGLSQENSLLEMIDLYETLDTVDQKKVLDFARNCMTDQKMNSAI